MSNVICLSWRVHTLPRQAPRQRPRLYRQGYSRFGWCSVLGLGDDWVQYPFLKPIGLSVAVHQCERTIIVELAKLLGEVAVCAVKMLDINICDWLTEKCSPVYLTVTDPDFSDGMGYHVKGDANLLFDQFLPKKIDLGRVSCAPTPNPPMHHP